MCPNDNNKVNVIYKDNGKKTSEAGFEPDFIKLNNNIKQIKNLPLWVQEVAARC